MRLRIAIGFGLGLALLVASVMPAGADFRFVRSIPAPYSRCGADQATGLDYEPEQNRLYLTVMCPDSVTFPTSYFYGIDPGDGMLLASADFVGAPPYCQDDNYHTISCASEVMGGMEMSDFWVGDSCGGIMRFTWWGEGDIGLEDTVEYFSLVDLAPEPVGLEMEFGTEGHPDYLYIADAAHQWVVVYDIVEATVVNLIPLPDVGVSRFVKSVTLYRDHLFVACMIVSGEIVRPIIYEMTKDGDFLGTHGLIGEWLPPTGIAFVGDSLYIAGPWNSIGIYAPVDFNTEVPEGDSVVVDAVPDEVAVTFDSVSTGGWMNVGVEASDSCPAPQGVTLFSNAYYVATDAQFDYAAEVELGTTEPLPGGVEAKNVRVFVRPSGACQTYRDITTAPTEVPTSLRRVFANLTRTKSEDDEFSVFALGEDLRNPAEVIDLKFGRIRSAIDAGQGSIPSGVLAAMNGLFDDARSAYYHGLSLDAAVLVDSIATIVRATPEIPHTYDPGLPGHNLAGRLISDAHTLSFSLRFSADEARLTQVGMAPECVNFSYDGWMRATIEVPPGLDANGIDEEHVYLMHAVRAVPDSVGVGDYDGDSAIEIRAVFRTSAVKAALGRPGYTACRLTCFIEGWEVYGDVAVSWLGVTLGMMGEGPYLAGSTVTVTWETTECGQASPVALWFSSDAGTTWTLLEDGIEGTSCELQVPSVVTACGLLKIVCVTDGGTTEIVGREFSIEGSAGVEGPNGNDGAEGAAAGLAVRPNPSKYSFVIEFSPSGRAPVEVAVYSVKGELVKTLQPTQAADGTLSLTWAGDNRQGGRVSPGTYFVIARQAGQRYAKKIVLEP